MARHSLRNAQMTFTTDRWPIMAGIRLAAAYGGAAALIAVAFAGAQLPSPAQANTGSGLDNIGMIDPAPAQTASDPVAGGGSGGSAQSTGPAQPIGTAQPARVPPAPAVETVNPDGSHAVPGSGPAVPPGSSAPTNSAAGNSSSGDSSAHTVPPFDPGYWTPDRMASAIPMTMTADGSAGNGSSGSAPAGTQTGASGWWLIPASGLAVPAPPGVVLLQPLKPGYQPITLPIGFSAEPVNLTAPQPTATPHIR